METLQDRQIARERLSGERGINQTLDQVRNARAFGREYDVFPGNTKLQAWYNEALPYVKNWVWASANKIEKSMQGMSRRSGYEQMIQTVSPEKMAYLAIRAALDYVDCCTGRTAKRQNLAVTIGYHIWLEARYDAMHEAERESAENRLAALVRTVRHYNPRSIKKWLRMLDYKHILQEEWPYKLRVVMGDELLGIILKCPSSMVTMESQYVPSRKKELTYIKYKESAEMRDRTLAQELSDKKNARPAHATMLVPPRPWTRVGDRLVGGYVNTDLSPFILQLVDLHVTGGIGDAFSTDRQTVSDHTIEAVNLVQSVPYKVNTDVLRVVSEALEDLDKYESLFGVESEEQTLIRIPDAEWAQYTEEQKKDIWQKRKIAHDKKYRYEAKIAGIKRAVAYAQMDSEEESIWFPHVIDWRRRVYPRPRDFHPQGGDICKGMLLFRDGKSLGPSGYKWLVFQLASSYGLDKVSRDDQQDWFNNNLDNILTVVNDPLGEGWEFFRRASEPWQFLAACIEVCRSNASSDYVSHLPVYVDGTCNGLQHLSALGRDRIGAQATNLTYSERRNDIYQIVADHVEEHLDLDHAYGKYWNGNVGRNTVKRGVMTYPYGLTLIGMKDQLLKDKWTDDYKAASYLAGKMKAGISETVVAAALIMEWLQFNTDVLSKYNIPVTWPTPAGDRIVQGYYTPQTKSLVTSLGRVRVLVTDPKKRLRVQKQRQSIVPNLVHSFDAAHLTLTVLQFMGAGYQLSPVHDSFGTHACDMDLLQIIIREVFCDIYSLDWMAIIQSEFEVYVPAEMLRKPPVMGDWKPEEVKESLYFFS